MRHLDLDVGTGNKLPRKVFRGKKVSGLFVLCCFVSGKEQQEEGWEPVTFEAEGFDMFESAEG